MFLKRSIFKISNLIAAGAQELVTIRVVNIVTIRATTILRAGRSDCPHAVFFSIRSYVRLFSFLVLYVSFSFFDLDVCLSVSLFILKEGYFLFCTSKPKVTHKSYERRKCRFFNVKSRCRLLISTTIYVRVLILTRIININ